MNPADSTTERGCDVDAGILRAFLTAALSHDAAQDAVDELIFEHVIGGRYHPSVVAESLRPIIDEILEATTREDWQAVAERLIGDARELEAEIRVEQLGWSTRLHRLAKSLRWLRC